MKKLLRCCLAKNYKGLATSHKHNLIESCLVNTQIMVNFIRNITNEGMYKVLTQGVSELLKLKHLSLQYQNISFLKLLIFMLLVIKLHTVCIVPHLIALNYA